MLGRQNRERKRGEREREREGEGGRVGLIEIDSDHSKGLDH